MAKDLTCYAYVDETHEFVCALQGDPDPLVERNILYPRNTTTVAPPQYNGGSTIPVFDEKTSKWTVQPDYRGLYGYDPDGVPVLITRAGDPTTFTPPLSRIAPTPENPVPDPNLVARTSKVVFWRRATEEEAAYFLADLTEASPRLKAIFDSVSYLVPGTPEYPALRAAIETRVGKTRADELLAPSND